MTEPQQNRSSKAHVAIPSEQSIEELEQFITTQRLYGMAGSGTKENYEAAVQQLQALVDKATREARADEVGKFAMHLNTRMVQGLPSAWKIYTNKRLEELSNKDKPAYGFENHPYIALDERDE